jgi:nitroreductase
VREGEIAASLQAAVDAATRAPSVHNTQPWSFHVGTDRIDLFADFSRQLSVTDPTGRQLHLSCGAALHHLTVTLHAAALQTEVQLLPDGSREHLASVSVTPAEEAEPEQQALAAAIFARHSQREPFADHPVLDESLVDLRGAVEAEGGWLAILRRRGDQITLAVLQAHADRAEIESPAYRAELAKWRHTQPAIDGISLDAVSKIQSGRHSEVVIRDYGVGDEPRPMSSFPAPQDPGRVPDERPALLILGTDSDSPEQWLIAGRALSRVLLKATMLGLRASMLGQVIDLPGTRSQLRRLLHLTGEPQMVLRVGYGAAAPSSPRRPLADVLI